MPKITDIRDFFEESVPASLKMDFDNVGFLAGESGREVKKVLLSLDITFEVIEEAGELGAGLIVSHHPLTFGGMKSVTDQDRTGKRFLSLIKRGMCAICLHTNLDAVQGGVNDALMSALGAVNVELMGDEDGISRMGFLPEIMDFHRFLKHTKSALNANGLRYHDAGKLVHRLGCCGGSGGEHLELALEKGCDTYVTADIKYDVFLAAKELGINLIDADHFCTENVVIPVLAEMLESAFPELDISISRRHTQTAQFF